MSTRAHVITRYEILYGSEGLAWGQDLLESLADEYIEDSYTGGEVGNTIPRKPFGSSTKNSSRQWLKPLPI